jgi:hypothetical protein
VYLKEVSLIFCFASWIIMGRCNRVNRKSEYQLPVKSKMLWKLPLPPAKHNHQERIKNFSYCIIDTQSTVLQHYPMVNVSTAFKGKNAIDNNATTF